MVKLNKNASAVEQANSTESDIAKLIHRIKYSKSEIAKNRAQINGELVNLQSYVVMDKVFLEFARIMYDNLNIALNHIIHEVLAFQMDLYTFKPTYVSDKLNVEMAIAKAKLNTIIETLKDVDSRINLLLSVNKKHPEYDLYNDLRLLNDLVRAITNSHSFKVDVMLVYAEENDQALRANQEFSVIQKAEVDSHLAMASWMVQFLTTYQNMVQRLVGQGLL